MTRVCRIYILHVCMQVKVSKTCICIIILSMHVHGTVHKCNLFVCRTSLSTFFAFNLIRHGFVYTNLSVSFTQTKLQFKLMKINLVNCHMEHEVRDVHSSVAHGDKQNIPYPTDKRQQSLLYSQMESKSNQENTVLEQSRTVENVGDNIQKL